MSEQKGYSRQPLYVITKSLLAVAAATSLKRGSVGCSEGEAHARIPSKGHRNEGDVSDLRPFASLTLRGSLDLIISLPFSSFLRWRSIKGVRTL